MNKIKSYLLLKITIFIFTFTFTFVSYSISEEIFNSPAGFWIADTLNKRQLYCPSNPEANWHIAQWNNPELLKCWTKKKNGEIVAESQNLKITIYKNGEQEIDSNGKNLPCRDKKLQRWYEFNANITPNTYKGYQIAYVGSPVLSKMNRVVYKITVTLEQAKFLDNHCTITQGSNLIALVLKNIVTNDVLFYKIQLFNLNNRNLTPKPYWYWAKGEGEKTIKEKIKVYGYSDILPTYGMDYLKIGETKQIELDVLPRLKQVLNDPRAIGLDRTSSNWIISSAYYGQNIWGGVKLISKWKNFSLSFN